MSEILTAIGIKVDPTKAKSGSKEVVDSLGDVDKASKRTTKLIAGVFAGVSVFQAVRLFKSVALDFAEFDQGMRNVASVSGATRKELDLLASTAKEVAEATRFNPKQATEGLYSLASAGLSVQQQIATLPNVLNLAEAAQAELGLTTELVVSTMAQFQISADESQRVVDTFTASIANSSANVQRLSVAMRNSGATANAFNQDFESSVSIVSILTTAFGNGEKAGTGYKSLLASIAKNSKKLGVDVADATGAMRPLGSILDEISGKGLPAVEVMELFGQEAGASLAVLLEKGSTGIREMTEKLLSNGQAAEVASKQLDTLKGDYDQLGSATDLLKIELGALTNDGLRPFIQGITSVVKAVRENIPEIIATIKALGAVIATVFGVKLLKTIALGLTGIGGASGIAASGIRGLTVAVAGLVSVGGGVLKFFGGWVGLLASVTVGVVTYVSTIGDAEKATASLVERNRELLNTMEEIALMPLAEALVETKSEIYDLTGSIEKAIEMYTFYGLTEDAIAVKMKGQFQTLKDLIIQRDNLTEKMREVAEERKKSAELIKKTNEAEKAEAEAIKKSADALDSWVKSAKQQIESLKRKNILLKDGKKALQDYIDKQARALATNAEELKLVNELITQTAELASSNEELTTAKENDAKQQEEVNKLYEDYINMSSPLIAIERDRQTELEKLDKLYQAGLIPSQHEYAIAIAQVNTEFNQMGKEIQTVNAVAGRSKGIFGKFFDTLRNGFKDVFSDIKGFFKSLGGRRNADGSGGSGSDSVSFYTDVATAVLDAYNASEGKDDAGRVAQTVVGVLELIPGWGQAIAAVATFVDGLTGGKLFGTAYEQTGSGFTGGIGPGGAIGSQFTEEQRERSFFRGTQTRINTEELDAQIAEIFEGIFEQAQNIASQTALSLGVNLAELVTGSISQEFDADGELVSSIVTVLGRTYNEGIEEFGRRIIAENILAQLAQTVGSVSVTNTTTSGGIDPRNFGDLVNDTSGIGETITTTTLVMNEVDAIANRWRFDSELLLEGAQLLLVAQNALMDGFELLNDGSLTSVVDLIEDFNRAGETLTETYTRVVTSVISFETALDLMGLAIFQKRGEFIQFAVDITDAAGGLEQASGLWGSYFNDFFTSTELIVAQLDNLNTDIAGMVADLGQDINFSNFRELFTDILPTLTPQEVVNWLRLGEALGNAHDLAGQLGSAGLTEVLESYVDIASEASQETMTLREQIDRNRKSLGGLIRAYDGSIESEREIAAGLSSRYQMELQFIDQIRSASQSISEMINGSIESIRMSQMTDEERFQYLTDQAEALAAGLSGLTDPAEIEAAIAEINRLQAEAFGLLDEGQQSQLADGFIEFLEEVGVLAQEQLDGIELDVKNDSENLVSRMAKLLEESQQREDEAIRRFDNSVTRMGEIVNTFGGVTERLKNIEIAVDLGGDVFEPRDVGNQ